MAQTTGKWLEMERYETVRLGKCGGETAKYGKQKNSGQCLTAVEPDESSAGRRKQEGKDDEADCVQPHIKAPGHLERGKFWTERYWL